MAASSNAQLLRKTIPDFVDKNGNFRTIPIGELKKRNLSESRLNLLKSLYTLIMTEGFLTRETRMYLTDPYITMNGINSILNRELEEKSPGSPEITLNATYSKIGAGKRKLNEYFGNSIMSDILFKTQNEEAIKQYSSRVAAAYAKNKKTSTNGVLRENLALELRTDIMNSELTSEKFDDFIATITPYIKEQMKVVADGIDDDTVGYFNYLLYSPILSDEDKLRLDRLRIYLDPNYSSDIKIE